VESIGQSMVWTVEYDGLLLALGLVWTRVGSIGQSYPIYIPWCAVGIALAGENGIHWTIPTHP
jgi:hypothetical protein